MIITNRKDFAYSIGITNYLKHEIATIFIDARYIIMKEKTLPLHSNKFSGNKLNGGFKILEERSITGSAICGQTTALRFDFNTFACYYQNQYDAKRTYVKYGFEFN